jgi:probable O-glycosylation ligase (exosortase A-associated)
MRDLILFIAMVFFLPLAFANAFVGYILWGWSGLIGIKDYIYGFMTIFPYVQIFAIITLFGLLFIKKNNKIEPYRINNTTVIMVIFAIHGFICAIFSYPGLERNWELYTTLLKTLLFCALMPLLVFNRFRIHAIVLMIVLGISFHGILDGLKFLASGGSHKAESLSKFGDNNYFGMIILMGLPFLFYLIKYSQKKIAQYAFGFVFFLNILSIISTQSRGALSGLVVISILYILSTKNKIIGVMVLSLSAFFIMQFASDGWKSRMETIQSAQDDNSFMGRVKAWQVSSAIALENPVFGGGFRVIQSHDVWHRFNHSSGILPFVKVDTSTRSGIAAHSIWFEVLADQGFVGFILFFALIVNSFITRNYIAKIIKNNNMSELWAIDLANVVCLSIVAYCVSGSLLSAAYFELPYICFMILEVTKLQLSRNASKIP